MGVSIRQVTAADKAVWSALWDKYLAFYETERGQEVKDSAWSRILDPKVPMYACLAEAPDGEAVGLVNYLFHTTFWEPTEVCYLNDLYVEPAARGTGAGHALIDEVVRHSRQENQTEVYWLTAEDNAVARRLYDLVSEKTPFVHYVVENS